MLALTLVSLHIHLSLYAMCNPHKAVMRKLTNSTACMHVPFGGACIMRSKQGESAMTEL